MRTLQTLRSMFWAAAREVNTRQFLAGRARPTSFPFISADTFRSLGDLLVNNENSASDVTQWMPNQAPQTVYIEMASLAKEATRLVILDIVDRFQQQNQVPLSVILHNWDTPPPEAFFARLAEMKTKVFAVNIQDGFHRATPIPLGIENLTRRRGGTLEDFHIFRDILLRGKDILPERENLVFSNFRIRTNRNAREKLATELSKSRHGFADGGMSIRAYREQILGSKFVVSPRGNGIDCFRTWESIYLGAVPIVLAGDLAQSLSNDLPIWVVSDWREVLDQSDDALDQIFMELSTRGLEKAFFPYWQRRILAL